MSHSSSTAANFRSGLPRLAMHEFYGESSASSVFWTTQGVMTTMLFPGQVSLADVSLLQVHILRGRQVHWTSPRDGLLEKTGESTAAPSDRTTLGVGPPCRTQDRAALVFSPPQFSCEGAWPQSSDTLVSQCDATDLGCNGGQMTMPSRQRKNTNNLHAATGAPARQVA